VRKYVTDDNIEYASAKKTKKGDRLIFQSLESSGGYGGLEGSDISEKLELYHSLKTNKDKFNTYLKDQRLKRLDKPRELERNQKFDLTNEKLEELMPNREFFGPRDKEDREVVHPFDFDFIFGTQTIPMDRPKYALPDPHDPLFVTKPLGRYEPASGTKVEVFQPDPNKSYKKMFPSEAGSQAEKRDIMKELNAEELQKVFVGPTTIDFGIVYVKSKVHKFFAVKNNLKTSIIVQISTTNGELQDSYQRPQVIPPMQTAGFEVCFYSHNLQRFRGNIKYTINNRHEFHFAVHAQVDPVKLLLETNNLGFKFQEKDEEMEIINTINIINKGSAPGRFNWDIQPNSVFKVSPLKGEVPADGQTKVSIIYTPSGVNFKGESERMIMQVENGENQYLTCTGFVNEARCEFREAALDFGNVLVSQEQPKAAYLKNKQKSTAVFKVSSKLPPGVTVFPMAGRIPPDGHVEFRVAVFSSEEKVIFDELVVSVRDGKQARLPIKAKVIIPQVKIVEDDFDFGGITYGSTSTLKMTLVNSSSLTAVLNVDLTNEQDYPGIQYLQILPASEPTDDESSFILSVNQDNKDNDPNGDLDDRENSLSMEDSDEEEEEKDKMRSFNIKVKENGELHFLLKFTPNDAKSYGFELPIRLQGYGKIEGLTRYISCKGLRPRCIIDPPSIEFKKKTITSFEKPMPDFEKVVLSNMDHTKTISWKFDTKDIDEERAFTIQPTQGKIEPGQQQIVTVSFSPGNPALYEKVVPFYLDNDMSRPYGTLTLKGLGDFPKLLFDRKEIILPVVPTDIEARCTFKIINDGYENLNLKYEIANDVGNLGKDLFRLEFPEGKNLGVTKPKLRVDAVFKSKKPLSFTVELNFIDDGKHVYRIRVSGTTDNSLFTNFPFMQRNFGEFEVLAQDEKPLLIRELDNDDSEASPKAFSMGVSKSGSVTSRAGRGLLGYTPIPQRELEKACESIKNWLNQNVLNSYISRFPHDIIECNGSQIYDLIQFLTGKTPAGKASLTLITKKAEKIKALHKQYDDLLRVLKENGALLNTIRPEYLLRHADYNSYMKQQDNQFIQPNNIKLTENKFVYLSTDAWITLFYQTLKIYFLGKVSLKTFKATPGMPPEKLMVPDYYLEGSNVIGIPENLLLRWLEVHYEKMRPGIPKRIKNFGEDLRDGHIFSAVIQSYVGNGATRSLGMMRNNLASKEDYIYNANKIINALEELGLQTPFSAKDLESPSQRDMILFTLYMFNNLPHYIPKATIEFSCLLRDTAIKYIELSNPAHKAISYRVHLEGDQDFSLEGTEDRDTNIHLEPKTSVRFPIKYTARLSKTTTGRILFTNKKEEGNIQAAALVFDLKSNVTGRVSVGTETMQTRLYELKSKDIRIENPFNMKADFQVEFIYQKNISPEPEKKKRNYGFAAKNKTPTRPEAKVDDFFMPFSCRHTTVTVPRMGFTTIPVTFLPFTMESHMCYIVLRDDKVGEIQYTVIGEVDLPASVEIPNPGMYYLENEQKFNAVIPVTNNQLQAARKNHIDRLPQAQRGREIDKEKVLRTHEKTFEHISYDIESLSQFLILPNNFVVQTNNKLKATPENSRKQDKSAAMKKKNGETSFDSRASQDLGASLVANTTTGSENKIPVGLAFRAPTKDHPLKFILRNSTKTDIRVYEIKVTVLPRPIKAVLEMKCPAGETVVQEIPIRNDSDRDWVIRAQLLTENGRNGHYFSGVNHVKEFRVAKKSTGNYPLQFRPPWMITAEAKLTLTNSYNNQQYDFELRGIGEEPLAEGHIILDCKARKTRSYMFKIKNDLLDRKVTYRVETDLYNASGKANFEVQPGKVEEYQLDVTPMLGGAYTGSVTFFDDTGKYKWWTVEVHTESPKSEKTIDLTTTIRKALAFDLTIANPLNKAVTFEVLMKGEGLFGENAFTLLPNQVGVYELIFSPLKAIKQTGSIAFVHEDLGELWYELNLQADDSQAIRLSTLRAELGKAEYHEVELQNPTGKEVRVRPRLSNPHGFDVMPEDLIIPPYDSLITQIRYMPSDLDIIEVIYSFLVNSYLKI